MGCMILYSYLMDNITIILQNIRSLGVSKVSPSGRLKLQYLFNKIPQTNCILILTEVNLKDVNLKLLKFKLPSNFRIINTNFNGRGFGTISISSNDLHKVHTPLIASTVVKGRVSHFKLKGESDTCFTVYPCYLSHSNANSIEQLVALREHINRNFDQNSRLLILGDFNFDARVHPHHTQREIVLNQICSDVNAVDMAIFFDNTRDTWHGPGARGLQKSSRLDRVYTNVPDFFSSFVVKGCPYSDHLGITLSNVKKNQEKLVPKWSNSLFSDFEFINAARDLTCRILLENSLYDVSTVLPEQFKV